MRVSPTCRLLAAIVVVFTAAGSALAEPTKPPAKPAAKPAGKPAKVDVAPMVAKLKSNDETQIRTALDQLRNAGAGAASAAPQVADLLGRGLSETTTVQAIDTLGDLESPEGSAVLAQYAGHRTLTIRRASVKALTRTRGPAAGAALRHALGDPDPQIRGAAASGLGALRAKDAVPDLFVALDHRVNEAAASIGQICSPDQCDQLVAKIGKVPFDVVTGGLDQILFRPSAEVSDEMKIKVLGQVRETGTAESNKFLKDIQKRLPKETSPRVKQAVEQAVRATAGGPQ
jgi:HEAT repeat protein